MIYSDISTRAASSMVADRGDTEHDTTPHFRRVNDSDERTYSFENRSIVQQRGFEQTTPSSSSLTQFTNSGTNRADISRPERNVRPPDR